MWRNNVPSANITNESDYLYKKLNDHFNVSQAIPSICGMKVHNAFAMKTMLHRLSFAISV